MDGWLNRQEKYIYKIMWMVGWIKKIRNNNNLKIGEGLDGQKKGIAGWTEKKQMYGWLDQGGKDGWLDGQTK